MKTKNQQKEIEKQLNLISKLYSTIDKLKSEKKVLQSKIKQYNPQKRSIKNNRDYKLKVKSILVSFYNDASKGDYLEALNKYIDELDNIKNK